MQIKVSVDARQLEQFAGRAPKRLGYAIQNALYETAYQVQSAAFKQVERRFAIRDRRLWFGTDAKKGGVAARITEFPSYAQNRLSIAIEAGKMSSKASIASARRLLVGELEYGGTRQPFTPGAKSVAVPALGSARPSRRSKIAPDLRLGRLKMRTYYKSGASNSRQLMLQRRTRHRKNQGIGIFREFGRLQSLSSVKGIQYKGANRSFILFSKAHPRGTVMQRIGRGRGPESRRRLWSYSAPFRIPPQLGWKAVAISKAQRYFSRAMDRAIADMLARDVLTGRRA